MTIPNKLLRKAKDYCCRQDDGKYKNYKKKHRKRLKRREKQIVKKTIKKELIEIVLKKL